ncbi:MAG TPA: FAD-binding oxidoreductase [Candidatus Baltobacteraceae bacterium]
MIEASVWSAATPTGGYAATSLPERADVVIAGAGIAGLSAALALATRGASVCVVEASHAGFGASSRNGGMALTGLKLDAATLRRRYGLPAARDMFEATLGAIDLVERLVELHGIDCAFARSGHLEVAAKPAHFADFIGTAELLRDAFGHRVRTLARDELAGELGSGAYYGGLLDERSAGLDPARYVAGLARAAVSAGSVLCENAAVTAVTRDGSDWRVDTSRGSLRAKSALAATGAYTGNAFAALRRRLVPLGSYVIATQRLAPDLARSLIPRNRMVYDSKRLLHYFRLTPDGRLLFGGRAAFLPEGPRTVAQSAQILRRDMLAVFPQLRGTEIEYAWGGTLDIAFDVMPHAATQDGVHYALGFAGHGVAMATLLGTLTGEALAGVPARHAFERALPAGPAWYRGRPWFLPLVGTWQRVLDRIA